MKNKIAKALLWRAALSVFLALTVLLASCLTEIEEKVIVKFDAAGGSPEPGDRELTKGAKLGFVDNPTRLGYWEFIGWECEFVKYNADTPVFTDLTLVAKWRDITPATEKNTITVTFNAPGAVPPITLVEVAEGKALGPLFPVEPRKRGSQFEGWLLNGVPFTKNTVVNGPVTVTADFSYKAMFYVTLRVPEIHQAANPGVDGTVFEVFEGDSIDEWEQQFPIHMSQAPDPNDVQFHQFFRWSENGWENGIIYTERSPITKTVELGAIYGLYFKKSTFEIDLDTINSNVSMDDYRKGEWWENLDEKFKAYSRNAAAAEIEKPVRLPLPSNVTPNADGSVTVTVQAKPTLMYFRPHPELWKLMRMAEVANDTKVSFFLDYEFENPAQEDDNNKLNIFFGNLMQNDNWNSTEVRDLTWKDIVFGQWNDVTSSREGSELHKLAATIINFDQNIDWIIFRMGREDTIVPFNVKIKGFTVTVEQ